MAKNFFPGRPGPDGGAIHALLGKQRHDKPVDRRAAKRQLDEQQELGTRPSNC